VIILRRVLRHLHFHSESYLLLNFIFCGTEVSW
jgi:hypothetical protein